jgi:hypothetical protein
MWMVLINVTVFISLRETTPDITKLSLADSDGEMLPKFVSEAHAHVSK